MEVALSRCSRTVDQHAYMRALWAAQGGVCAQCRAELYHPDDVRDAGYLNYPDSPSLDHVIPKSAGGTNYFRNLLLVHRSCNQERSSDPACGNMIAMQETVRKALRGRGRKLLEGSI